MIASQYSFSLETRSWCYICSGHVVKHVFLRLACRPGHLCSTTVLNNGVMNFHLLQSVKITKKKRIIIMNLHLHISHLSKNCSSCHLDIALGHIAISIYFCCGFTILLLFSTLADTFIQSTTTIRCYGSSSSMSSVFLLPPCITVWLTMKGVPPHG